LALLSAVALWICRALPMAGLVQDGIGLLVMALISVGALAFIVRRP
jgi:hypothetical protein